MAVNLEDLNTAQNLPEVARQIIAEYRAGRTDNFEQIFEFIENQIIYGSDEVRQKMIVELLENLKNFSAWED